MEDDKMPEPSRAERRRMLEAELAALRAEDREAAAEKESAAPADPVGFTHYVHLADGRVIRHDMTTNGKKNPYVNDHGSHYVEGEIDDDGTDNRVQTQVIGVYPR